MTYWEKRGVHADTMPYCGLCFASTVHGPTDTRCAVTKAGHLVSVEVL